MYHVYILLTKLRLTSNKYLIEYSTYICFPIFSNIFEIKDHQNSGGAIRNSLWNQKLIPSTTTTKNWCVYN